MPEELKVGCARPTGGLVGEEPTRDESQEQNIKEKEVRQIVKVGKKAPDFIAPAYYKGKFVNVKLSEYLGK